MQRGFSLITGMAFVALIALIGGLATNGLLQLEALGAQMRAVVEEHNRKIDIITQTQVAAHTRTDSLYRMALADDPFVRDVHFMEFNRAGFLVGSGRNALRGMGFTPPEQALFDAQTELVNRIQAVQERITDLLNAGRDAEARRMLTLEAIPLQQTFNLQLARMRNDYQQDTLAAQRAAELTYRRSVQLTLAFGVAAVMLALLIAWLTLRRIGAESRQINSQMFELERSRAALHEEATHDALTGLANRRLFHDRLHQALRHAHRYGTRLCILFVDLDRFKSVNDVHGHHVGDAVLVEVAKRLQEHVRESDTVARLGGDEFAVLLEEVADRTHCLAAAAKLEQSLRHALQAGDLQVDIGASIGLAVYPNDGADEDALLRAADAAMYRVKTGGDTEPQSPLPAPSAT